MEIIIKIDIDGKEVKDVKLVYLMDSKGFYQPVYDFIIKTDKDMRNIYIPAIQ